MPTPLEELKKKELPIIEDLRSQIFAYLKKGMKHGFSEFNSQWVMEASEEDDLTIILDEALSQAIRYGFQSDRQEVIEYIKGIKKDRPFYGTVRAINHTRDYDQALSDIITFLEERK